ncbi:MAG TPA: nitrilase-related carbon-nitrogen hydrolase [Acidimicrobiales bacterium]|nr:nitrilase-related carbon-nitrogen hydrolase [Acidimicrobiales bacterium]
MRLALAQLASHLGNLDANVERAGEEIASARAAGADLTVFPELFLTGYRLASPGDLAITDRGDHLGRLAAATGPAAAVVGFVEEGHRLNLYNSAAYLERHTVAHVHRKNYLVTYHGFDEGHYFTPGPSTRAFDADLGRVAVLICNDAWQPALVFLAVEDGATVLVIPSNSAHSSFDRLADTRRYWSYITRFYAMLFQCYVVFVNRVGTEATMAFWGGSHVVDPWGDTCHQLPLWTECTSLVDIDLSLVRRRRQEAPFLKDTRLGHLTRQFRQLLAETGGD